MSEQVELVKPREALEQAGAETQLLSLGPPFCLVVREDRYRAAAVLNGSNP